MVVVAHCALSFSPWTAIFSPDGAFAELSNAPSSKFFSELLWNLNLWLMPLFMLLAGASVCYTLGKRSNRQYVRERLLHLGFPLIVLLVIFIIPATYWVRSSSGQFDGSLLEFYLHYFEGVAPDGNFALFHMWFLVYLLIYALLALPLFQFFASAAGRRLMDKLARASKRTGGIYLFAIPLVIVQLALIHVSPPPVFAALVNDGTRFVSFFLVFIFGYILNSDSRFQMAIARQWRLIAIVTVVTSAVMFVIAWQDSFNPYVSLPLDYSWEYVGFWTVFALSSWSWLITWLGVGQRFLNVNHSLLKRASTVTYPLYLLHPIVWIPSLFIVLPWQVNPFFGFVAQTVIVLIGTLALTALLQCWSVTRFLLGLKTKTAPSQFSLRRSKGEENLPQGVSATAEKGAILVQ